MNNHLIEYSGSSISYSRIGEKSDPALCFLPGWCCDKSIWKAEAVRFQSNRNVLLIDFPGFGGSKIAASELASAALFNHMANCVKAVLDAEEISSCILVGHSMSGALTLQLAAEYPDLIEAVVGVDALYLGFYTQVFPEAGIDEALTPFNQDFKSTVQAVAESYFTENSDANMAQQIVETMLSQDKETALAVAASFFRWDMKACLDAYTGKVHIIAGDLLYSQIQDPAQHFNIDVDVIADAGHFVMLDQPREFSNKLSQFLESCK